MGGSSKRNPPDMYGQEERVWMFPGTVQYNGQINFRLLLKIEMQINLVLINL